MKRSARIFHYQLLPVIIFTVAYELLRRAADAEALHIARGLDLFAFGLALALALFHPLLVQQLVRYLVCDGFAILKNRTTLKPDEMSLRQLLWGVEEWVPRELPFNGEVALAGRGMDIYLRLYIPRRLGDTSASRHLARHLQHALPQLDAHIQESLYKASQQDPTMATAFDGSQLINDAELEVIKSQILSTLELTVPDGVEYCVDTRLIDIDKRVRKQPRQDLGTVTTGELDEDELDLTLSEVL